MMVINGYELPEIGQRWTAHNKKRVLDAVESGLVSLEIVCRLYQMSPAEYESWKEHYQEHGLEGLQTTLTQQHRATAHPS